MLRCGWGRSEALFSLRPCVQSMCGCGDKGCETIFKLVHQKVIRGVELGLQYLGMSVEVFLKPNEAFSERNIDIDWAAVIVRTLHSMKPIIEQ